MRHIRPSVVASLLLASLLTVTSAPVTAGEDTLININTASAAELSQLSGIGDAKARDIVAYREKSGPFKSVDDLRQVNGIGEKLLGKVRSQVTVSAAAAPLPAAAAAPKH